MKEQTRNHQCWGRMGYFLLRRCGRRGEWLVFCHEHQSHWLLIPLALLAVQGLVADGVTVYGGFKGPTQEELKLQERVLTDISLTCHFWKNGYMSLYPNGGWAYFLNKPGYTNVWEKLQGEPKPSYTPENWARFHRLFEEGINNVRLGLQNAATAYADVLPPDVRSEIWGVRLQLSVEQGAYRELDPNNLRLPAGDPVVFYRVRFEEVIRQLQGLDDKVQELRDEVNVRLSSP